MTTEQKTPPTLADLIELADTADAAARNRNEVAAIEHATRLIEKARTAAQRAIGLSNTEAELRLKVTIDERTDVARIYYASPDGMDGSFHLRYVPERHLGGGYGYEPDHVQPLHHCCECNGLVRRHESSEPIRDPLGLGYALRAPEEAVRHDVGHEEHCSLAWREEDDSQPAAFSSRPAPATPTVDESLARIAAALEEITGRWSA